MPTTWYDAQITKIVDESPNTRRFWLEIPAATEGFHFLPGQFITLDLPLGDKRLQRWRSYSIASPPDGSNVIELCIVRLEGGAATTYLFEEAGIGHNLRFKGPDGGFVLPSQLDKDLVLVCTGTGVAPFRSMLQHLHRTGQPHRHIHLIFGTRHADGILYRDEFAALARDMPNFRYSVALSRETDLQSHTFPFPVVAGYVHQLYAQAYHPARPDVAFFLCGWTQMIDQAVATLLVDLGYQKSQVMYELYG